MTKTTVRKAYFNGERALVSSEGQVFRRKALAWVEPSPLSEVIPVGDTYERWCDVPSAWLNGCPYWK